MNATYHYDNTDRLIHTITGIEELTVDLDVALAIQFLQVRAHREINQTAVRKYVADLRNGNWETTYEPISFGKDGLMYSGAARCKAVEITKITIPNVKVHKGLDADACHALDQGRRRTAADRLHDAGVMNHNQVASTIKKTLSLVDFGGHFVRNQLVTIYTPAQVYREYLAHSAEYNNAVTLGMRLHGINRGLPVAVCAAIYVYQTVYLGKTDAQVMPFFDQFTTGTPGWAASALNRLYSTDLLLRTDPNLMSRQEKFGSMGLAWNAYWNNTPAPAGGHAGANTAIRFDPIVHSGMVMV